jgi:hypothetical protein
MAARQVVCGAIGSAAVAGAAPLAAAAGDPPEVLACRRLRVHAAGPDVATGPTTDGIATRAVWATAPLPRAWYRLPTPELVKRDVSVVQPRPDGGMELHTGVSGARPLYVDRNEPGTLRFATSVGALARSRAGGITADWDAWAAILALGGPLAGRSPFAGIERLGPQASVTVGPDDRLTSTTRWDWLEIEGGGLELSRGLDELREALHQTVRSLAAENELAPLLSGGWDSRILATLATVARSAPPTMWTTSSDIGTVFDELVAAEVAAHLRAPHRIVPARFDAFTDDARWYAAAVEHQSSFHVWIAPLARALAASAATVLDGLGGGIFVGGAFPEPDGDGDLVTRRFARMARYLDHADQIVRPEVAEQLRERAWSDFEAIARPIVDHPNARAFTAYLTRTVPGISLGPYAAVAATAAVATPFLADEVVRAALRLDPKARADGALYPPLLAPFSAALAALPTAAARSGRQRRRQRRVSSPAAAAWYRSVVTAGAVGDLLTAELRGAAVEVWQQHLGRTRGQHLLRSLATLSLWLDEHDRLLVGPAVDVLAGPTG